MRDYSDDISALFRPVSLPELDAVALQSRFETKYLFPESRLPELLPQLLPDYRILEIDGCRRFDYLTWYFDTADFRLYRDHHNGYARRMKIRQRRYEQSGDVYFEVKRKASELKTDKARFRIPGMQQSIAPGMYEGLAGSRLEAAPLEYKLSNRFRRITLCNQAMTERVTLDTGIVMDRDLAAHPRERRPGRRRRPW